MPNQDNDKIKITVEGTTKRALSEALAHALLHRPWADDDMSENIEQQARKHAERMLEEEVAAGVRDAIREHTVARAREVVEKTLAAGIPQTDSYGTPKQTLTWEQYVRSLLITDGYDRDKVGRIARETVDKLFQGELKKLMDAVVAEVKAKVDELVGEKISAALRQAVGVK